MPGVLSLDVLDRGESDASTRSMAGDSPSLGHFYSWLVLEGKEGPSVK